MPTCTAAAVTPALALLIALTTDWSEPSPDDTTLPVMVPACNPPESVAVMLPVPVLIEMVPPARSGVVLPNVWAAPPSTVTMPSVPCSEVASTVRPSAASALPPVTRIVAALPWPEVASDRDPFAPTEAVAAALSAVNACCTAAASDAALYVPAASVRL